MSIEPGRGSAPEIEPPAGPAPAPPRAERRELGLMLASALLLFTVGALRQALPAIDDCFYARKASEMAERGFSFTVTFGGSPTFQNPPGHFWIVGAAFRLLGENDFAARLPSALMALGILVATWRIGHLTVGGQAPLVAVAVLLLTPGFAHNARRVMMEIPLTFWTALCVLAFLEGLTRRAWLIVLALGLGAAILTKSVLGLLPLLVIGSGLLLVPEWRQGARSAWLWIATLAGLLLGSTWTIDQAARFPDFLQAHYGAEILERAGQSTSIARAALDYPLILLKSFQPVIIPALIGGALILKDPRARRGPSGFVAAWAFLPIAAYSFSSTRAARYVFPMLPALALCTAVAATRFLPRFAAFLPRFVAPGVAVLAASVFAVRPALLSRPGTQFFKDHSATIAVVLPGQSPVPYLGSRYWNVANPLLYYSGRRLESPRASAPEALAAAVRTPSRVLLVDADRLEEALSTAPRATRLLEAPGWAVLRLEDGPPATSGLTGSVAPP